jgi:hypothetical protein
MLRLLNFPRRAVVCVALLASIWDLLSYSLTTSFVQDAWEEKARRPQQSSSTPSTLQQARVAPANTTHHKDGRKTFLCAIAKHEEAYLDEWLDYHLGLGVAHIFIYDNSYHFDLQQWAAEQEEAGRPVTVRHHVGVAQQEEAYRDCTTRLQQHQQQQQRDEDAVHEESELWWVGFLDIDEFLILRQHAHVNDFLADFCPTGAVSLTWILMGSNMQKLFSPRPVSRRFVWKWNSTHDFGTQAYLVKTFARVDHIDVQRKFNAHFCTLYDEYKRVDTQGLVSSTEGRRNPRGTDAIATVYHYRSKSAKEYREKFLRGRAGSRGADEEVVQHSISNGRYGRYLEPGDVRDWAVWNQLKRANSLYQTFDKPLSASPTPLHSSGQRVAICGNLRQGDDAYVDEWVDYHRMLGFSQFYLFDNDWRMEFTQWARKKGPYVVLKPWQWLKNRPYATQVNQQQKWCSQMARRNGDAWLAFFDVNDFLVLKKNQTHVVDLLDQFQDQEGVGIYQYRFGTSGRRIYQPKPVTQRFRYRQPVAENTVRRIVRLEALEVGNAPRRSLVVNTLGEPIPEGVERRSRPTDTAVFHNYETKSMKEYLLRKFGVRVLGRPMGSNESAHYEPEIWEVFNGSLPFGAVYDDSAWEALKRTNPRYTIYESLWVP